MRRPFHWDKKYLYWGITAFCVIAACIAFYMLLNYLPALGKALGKLMRILSPFIWGLILSYLLAPLTRWLERAVFRPLSRKIFRKSKRSDGSKLARGLSVLVSELVLLAVLAALVYMILPQLYSSIETIVKNGDKYVSNLTAWVTGLLKDYPDITQYITESLNTLNTDIISWISNKLLPSFGSVLTNITSGVYYVLRALYDLVIGIIVSVYILSDLEGFGASFRRILYSLFSIETAEKIRSIIGFTDKTFMGFLNGKLLDSAIIGVICYIVCAALRMPYALLVSVIVGLTNIIPFFGPLIGAIPSTIIILMVDPMKALIFVIFVVVLQQVDGNFIGPKILGSSVGISGFWVMFSIIVGAGLFNFWGMLLGVPVFVVIQTLVVDRLKKRLKKSDLPEEVAGYVDLDHIDPVTREPVKKQKTVLTAEKGPTKASDKAPEQDRDDAQP
ncbi:MAG: AI-2E family transporter [Oscillospiraceae bacterium]|nr:AI-2E family transporter [Oscillospiraceae bacterium]